MLNKDIFNGSKPLENQFNRIIYDFISKGVNFTLPDELSTYVDDGYAGNVNIYPIIRKIVNPVMGVKWYLKDRQTEEEAQDQTMMQLLKKPNPQYGQWAFIDEALVWRLITGNRYIYWIAPENGVNRGKPAELWLLPASEVEIVQGEMFNPVKGYKLRIGNTYREIEAKYVIHGKTTNLKYGVNGEQLYGMSPLAAALKVMTATNEGYDQLQKNFENGGPDVIITNAQETAGTQEWTKEQRDSVWESFINRFRKKSKERFMIKNLPVEVHEIGKSPVDLNILEYLKLSLRDYCNIYNVPSALMNDNEYATQSANAREYQRQLWNNAIIPEIEMLKEDMNRIAEIYNAAANSQVYFDYDLSDIPELQADRAEQATWIDKAHGLTLREKLTLMGISIESDDPILDLRLVPMGWGVLDDLMIPLNETEANKHLDHRGIKY